LKVLCVVHGYPPSIGGSQWLTKNICERLVSDYRDDVSVFTTTAYHTDTFWRSDKSVWAPLTEVVNGVRVRRFTVFNRLTLLRKLVASISYRLRLPYNDWLRTIHNGPLIFDMTQAVADSGANVVFATAFPMLHMYYALAGARRAHIPTVYLGALHIADKYGYNRSMIFEAIQQADAYIAHTAFERDHLVERGIQPAKISVIGGGVDADAFCNANGTETRRRFGLGDAPVVAGIGKQDDRKRFETLLQAMPYVWDVYPHVHLLIAGAKGSSTPQILERIASLPPDRRSYVTMINDFAEEEKAPLLHACDLCVLPSGYEAFGIVFAEAWACAKPVIGARIGAIPSVIDEGHDGLLFAYQDADSLARAILELVMDPERRVRMGQAGRKKVLENNTWAAVTQRMRTVFVKAISSHTQRC
jgi:glycosyltransferase involved in cell wall biosynthesis